MIKEIYMGEIDGQVITRPATLAERANDTGIVVEFIAKSAPYYLNCAYNAGMRIIGEDEQYIQVEGSEAEYDHFLNLAHDLSTRD